ncbi:hypothetical protein BKH43_03615 [Helicobacter sp. 13S00401-1]|uniref:DUF7488 domain-containing protein n=1 Tax=Helicobacter sp. 13S00401-1 TaxID=1905758 RepID=UPI000BA7D07F|nr:PDZ domain-containing protein [Helicobacter sp. 13S00401-1]PAF50954.1 hypothetical protein BKH43_03615 [Helicobacter sp. 13S00401-1]
MKTSTFSKVALGCLLVSVLSAQDSNTSNPAISSTNMGASMQNVDAPNANAIDEFQSGSFSSGKFYPKETVLLDSMTKEELSLKSSPTGPKKSAKLIKVDAHEMNVTNALLDGKPSLDTNTYMSKNTEANSSADLSLDSNKNSNEALDKASVQDDALALNSTSDEDKHEIKESSMQEMKDVKKDALAQKEPMLSDKSFGVQKVEGLYPVSASGERLDYAACGDYYHQASLRLGDGTYAVYLKGKGFVGFSKTRPKDARVAKYDPFSGLFLLDSNLKSKLGYTLMDIDTYARTRELVSADAKGARGVRLAKAQEGFLDYGRINGHIAQNGVLSNICYQIYGIGVGGDSFIEKPYIMRFLDSKSVHYGDIGVRFKLSDAENANFEVLYVDPFFKDNPFRKGDVLISINNVAPRSFKDLSERILNLKQGSLVKVDVRRDGKVLSFEVRAGKRYGGLLLPDSFLERFNLKLSDDFVVLSAPSSGKFSELKKGDKILKINNLDLKEYIKPMHINRDKTLRELFTKLYMMKVKSNKATLINSSPKSKEDELASYIAQFANKHSSKKPVKEKANSMQNSMTKESMDNEQGGLKSGADLEAFLNMNSPMLDSTPNAMDTNSMGSITKANKQETKDTKLDLGSLDMLISRDGFEFRLVVK